MRFHRHPVRWLSSWLIVALLFMQLATAVHACPLWAVPDLRPQPTVDMPGCDMQGNGVANDPVSALCQGHCQQGQQALDQSPAADLAAAPLLLAVLDWAAPAVMGDAAQADAARRTGVASGAPPPGALPIYLSLLVLRN
jgi:hypothetical protein